MLRSRHLVLLGLILSASTISHAQVQTTGTIISISASNQYIAIAADSKESGTSPKSVCKIDPLGDKFIFTIDGIESMGSKLRPELRWDAKQEAQKAFERTRSVSIMDPYHDPASQMAWEWTNATKQAFAQMIRYSPKLFWSGSQNGDIEAFFGGFDSSGRTDIAMVELARPLRQGDNYTDKILPYYAGMGTTAAFGTVNLGDNELANELLQSGKYKGAPGRSPEEQASLRTIDMVQQTIDHPPHENTVGPPIHALTLKSGGTVQWVPGKECKL